MDVSSMVGTRAQMAGASRSRSRGHDMRDDHDTGFIQPSSSSGQTSFHEDDQVRSNSRRRNRTAEQASHSDELRKLELRLTQQLKRGNQTWDEHSTVSSQHLRKLEKKLVQTLKKEDEKRAAKLQRLRTRNQNRKQMSSEVMTVDFAKDEQMAKNVVSPETPPTVSRQRTADTREGRSKYDQLRVLRQQRPMHKYMQRSVSRPRDSNGPREAY